MSFFNRPLALGAILLVSVVGTAGALAQSTEDMLTSYMAAVNDNMPPNLDADAVAALYAEDAKKGHPMGPPPNRNNPMKGREEIRDFFAGFSKTWANWTHTESRRTIQGRHAVWEGTASGTHKDTGKPVSAPIAFSIKFNDDGTVSEIDVYFNGGLIAAQLK